MGVITEFNEKIDAAKLNLEEAIKNIRDCTDEEIYGYSDVNQEYKDNLIEVLMQLIKIKRTL
jgi:bifunctional pyridoxal-dependent enzyme with beta-cystathionase and maltose regulon repressor activities